MIDAIRFCFIGALLSGLGACAVQTFGESEYTDIDLHVHWKEPAEVTELAHTYGYKGKYDGFSIRNDRDGVRRCDIFAPKPRHVADYKWMQVLSHELMHCLDGSYHE